MPRKKASPGAAKEAPPIRAFKSAREWEKWLSKNHARADGILVRYFKKESGVPSLRYAEALDVALCYGWIDGQARSRDASSWLQRFTPRRPRSLWSKRNREHVARLVAEGRMTPHGLKAVAAAKADGRWDRAYDSPSTMRIPKDFLSALSRIKGAKRFFATLNKTNLYAIAWRLQTAKKPETRGRRMKAILGMMARGEKFH
jgi:uncharacterized protein YdeI (YjbR/CyaY-like superfamily)